MLRRTNYGFWVDDKGYNSETENAIEYIVNCAKDNGIEVIEGQTTLSILFIANIMKVMNENKRPKGEWLERDAKYWDAHEKEFLRKDRYCFNCGKRAMHDEDDYILTDFCPYCGADMRGDKE